MPLCHQRICSCSKFFCERFPISVCITCHWNCCIAVPIKLLSRIFILFNDSNQFNSFLWHHKTHIINSPPPGITLRHTIKHPVRKRPAWRLNGHRHSHSNIIARCRKKHTFWLTAYNIRLKVVWIILHQYAINI